MHLGMRSRGYARGDGDAYMRRDGIGRVAHVVVDWQVVTRVVVTRD